MARAVAGTRQQIAFYGSTPAYRGVLDVHGWGGLGDELNALSTIASREDKWEAMGALIADEVLHAFAVVAEPAGWRRRSGSGSAAWWTACRSTPPTRPTPRPGTRSSPTCGLRPAILRHFRPSWQPELTNDLEEKAWTNSW